jgi:AcrR family transcriptional regulator
MLSGVPKLWSETIDGHRRAVREAAVSAAAALLSERGIAGLTMSGIAERAGIGRATLYKHFPDVEAVLVAWHESHVEHHLQLLGRVRDHVTDPGARIEAVLTTYAHAVHHQGSSSAAALLHEKDHVADARRRLAGFVRELLEESVAHGAVRDDVPTDELTAYCLSAVNAAASLTDDEGIDRLIHLIMGGLRRQPITRR